MSYSYNQIMEQQRQLLDFQIPFELGSGSSNQTSAVPSLTQEAEQILLGSLLGDGTIQKFLYGNCLFCETHSIKQREYLLWKNNFLKFKVIYSNYYYKQLKRNYEAVTIRSRCLPLFTDYRYLFYPNGKKIVTREILDKLEPLGIAVWYMDDGTYDYKRDRLRLSTETFTFEEVILIKEWLNNKYRIESKVQRVVYRGKEHYVLVINRVNGIKLVGVIREYVPKSMEYKLGLDNDRRKRIKEKDRIYGNKYKKEEYHRRKNEPRYKELRKKQMKRYLKKKKQLRIRKELGLQGG